ncbi:MAG TPA: galactokinase family protein, partial [Pyrinomonadaceae bacterium]|nr:galactokinase family protein [Pyrinomonadaceae bacterium]
MYRIESGTTHGLADTADFIALLNGPRESGPEGLGGFFDARGELFVARAPGRLDLMGGIADYSGSLVLELPVEAATHVAVQLGEDRTLGLASLRAGGPRLLEMPLSDLEDGAGRPLEYAEAADYFKRERGRRWAAYVAGAFLVLMR